MFNIEYYGMSGSLIGTDKNVEFEDIGARLAKFAQVAQDGDTIRLIELADEFQEALDRMADNARELGLEY